MEPQIIPVVRSVLINKNWYRFTHCLIIGTMISCVSMCAALLVVALDKWGQKKLDEYVYNR